MRIKEKMNKGLCELSNKVVGSGMSLYTWGEQEVPDSLIAGYKKEMDEKEGDGRKNKR